MILETNTDKKLLLPKMKIFFTHSIYGTSFPVCVKRTWTIQNIIAQFLNCYNDCSNFHSLKFDSSYHLKLFDNFCMYVWMKHVSIFLPSFWVRPKHFLSIKQKSCIVLCKILNKQISLLMFGSWKNIQFFYGNLILHVSDPNIILWYHFIGNK